MIQFLASAAGRVSSTRLAIPLVLALAACAQNPSAGGSAAPQSGPRFDISYRVAMPDPASHWYDVTIDVGRVTGDTVKLQLPVWSPGRYAKMDFAKNLQGLTVTAGNGQPLRWDKENGSLWRVATGGADKLRVRYRMFSNTLSGTFSVLDSAHANWNGASLFMYVENHKPDPVHLTIVPPAGWHIINGSAKQLDQTEYDFPNYDQLIDTPTEVAPTVTVDSFRVDGRLYRVAVHHNGPDNGQRARFVRDVEKIVRYENRVIAPPPLDSYTFLFNIGYAGSDGMEHLYSTEIIDSRPWAEGMEVLSGIGTAAHEYFHTWNVKRMRPAALGPFDYTREQYQPSLWVAEGWTQYYGEMGLHRAGITNRESTYQAVAGTIRAVTETPGARETSARMASFHAPFWDGAPQGQATARNTVWISYYTKGAAIATVLDLMARGRSNNAKSMDDIARALKARSWDQPNASYYLQGRGYSEADVEAAASEVMGMDMHPWFDRYVGGVELLPWDDALAMAGLKLVITGEGAARAYTIEEKADATAAQKRVREGWLEGRTG
ncbi:MAG: hypothetical protein M3081_08820 [Gemmatimonadota bacterium]|nr:hypothetical protein [Gemmatimonadota bacterium]